MGHPRLQRAVRRLTTETLTVTRVGPITGTTGGYVNFPNSSTFTIRAVVHPIIGAEAEFRPDGTRAHEKIALYVTSDQTSMRIPVDGGSTQPDTFVWRSTVWRLMHREHWDHFGYYRYEAEKMLF